MEPNVTQKTSPSIRKATAADAELLAELGARTFYETFAPDNTEDDMTQYLAASFHPEQQRSELADSLTTFLLAEIDQIVAGYAMLRAAAPPNQPHAVKSIELVRFYVCKEWHGRGVSHELMQACLDEASEQGYLTLWLGVWEHNARARAFYRKCRFEEFGEHAFMLGNDLQNDILMKVSC
jgi:ribosomal protein S18 acetylase RimI-like enzyme